MDMTNNTNAIRKNLNFSGTLDLFYSSIQEIK